MSRRSLSFERELVNASPDAQLALDAEGTILFWNRAAEDMFGYSRKEAVGQRFYDVIVPPANREEALATLTRVQQTGSLAYEAVRQRKDGTTLIVDGGYMAR